MKKAIVAGLVVAAGIAGALWAEEEASNPVVKARMEAMEEIGGSMKVLGDMAKGAVAFDAAAAQAAVDKIVAEASEVPALFEANESDPASEALPVIWEDYADFTAKAGDLKTAAEGITISAQADIGPAMGTLGGACKACHSKYRVAK
ncbi:c-type cytochrome [Tropicibacter sp. S64]|uniref:c-type cytochrome n=1 Tax=Tropicibacter sp. S64 TaxID=3415122 RepID=UPI003C7E421D